MCIVLSETGLVVDLVKMPFIPIRTEVTRAVLTAANLDERYHHHLLAHAETQNSSFISPFPLPFWWRSPFFYFLEVPNIVLSLWASLTALVGTLICLSRTTAVFFYLITLRVSANLYYSFHCQMIFPSGFVIFNKLKISEKYKDYISPL